MSLLNLTPGLSSASGRVTPSLERDTNERIGTTKHLTKKAAGCPQRCSFTWALCDHSLFEITSCVTVLTVKRDESLAGRSEPSENPFVPEVFTVVEEVYSPKYKYQYLSAHLLRYMLDEEIDTTLISVRET